MRIRSVLIAALVAAVGMLAFVSSAFSVNNFKAYDETDEHGNETSFACVTGTGYRGLLIESAVNNCEYRVYLEGPPTNPFSYCINPKTTINSIPSADRGPKEIYIGAAEKC